MLYRAIGLMSGSSLDGLDIAYAEFQEQSGKWDYTILATDCVTYPAEWADRLRTATELSARDYQQLHADYGHYIGEAVNQFIEKNQLNYKVSLISSHGHTTFHVPSKKMGAQLGNGASIAAETGLPVVTDLRALDLALGGQGAPIVPIGEKLLLGDYDYFLNIGGIANISFNADPYIAFDICPANRVLNLLAVELGMEYDEGGNLAAAGTVNDDLLQKLNALDYYKQPYPKSLANDFGTDVVYPMIKEAVVTTQDALRTFDEHIALQIRNAIQNLGDPRLPTPDSRLLITGGGAHNNFLVQRLQELLIELNIKVKVPEKELVNFKEALIMAFIGVLRWRQEYNVLSSVTGSVRDSIGGALWTGADA